MREVKGQLLGVSIYASHLLHTTGGEKLGKHYHCLDVPQKF
jgi:hypothetical protein